MPGVRHVINAGECRLLLLQEVEGTGDEGDDGEGRQGRVAVTMAHNALMGGRGAGHVPITRLLHGSLLISATWRATSME